MDLATLELSRHVDLGTPEAPSPAAVAAAEVWAAEEEAEFGHADFAYSGGELAAVYADHDRHHWLMVLAHRGRDCVGLAHLDVPVSDNEHMLSVEFRVDPGADVAEVLDALWPAVVEEAARERRDTIVVWANSTRPGEPALAPRTGAGTIRRTPLADWLIGRGFHLEQVEVASTLEMAEAVPRILELGERAAVAGADYDVLTWLGPTPPEFQDAMAEQRARMSTDVPLGDLAMEPEVWDAARVRAEEAVEVAMGREMVWAIAVERASGDVAAHTLIVCPDGVRPEVAYQEDTLVRAEHRGHRLGMRVKAANLRQLAAARPGVCRIHTWNADENEWMLAINRELGFRPTATMGCWQLKLP